MLEQVGRFVGSLAADVVNVFRGRQAVPCLVEWDDAAYTATTSGAVGDDGCGDCAGNCCLTTDTLNEWGK